MITLLVTQFDVGHIAEGHPMTVQTADGTEYNLRCRYRHPFDGTANPRNLPAVSLSRDDFAQIAMGRTVSTSLEGLREGEDYLTRVDVRLMTLEEYRAAKARSRAWFEDNSLPYPDQPEESTELWLVTPLRASF